MLTRIDATEFILGFTDGEQGEISTGRAQLTVHQLAGFPSSMQGVTVSHRYRPCAESSYDYHASKGRKLERTTSMLG